MKNDAACEIVLQVKLKRGRRKEGEGKKREREETVKKFVQTDHEPSHG